MNIENDQTYSKDQNDPEVESLGVRLKEIKIGGQTNTLENLLKTYPTISSLPRENQLEAIFKDLITSFAKNIKEANINQLIETISAIRTTMCNSENQSLDLCVNSGIVPFLLELINGYFSEDELMIECGWILALLAAGPTKCIDYLISLDVINKALQLFKHPNNEVKDNALWILANIAGESFEFRDILLTQTQIVGEIEFCLNNSEHKTSFLKTISWLICNLCRGKPLPDPNQIYPLIKLAAAFLLSNCEPALYDSIWVISFFTDGSDELRKFVLNLGVGEKLIELLHSTRNDIIEPSLRAVGNLLSGDDEIVFYMLDKGVLGGLLDLLDSPRPLIRKEVCWSLSNIFCGKTLTKEVFNYKNCDIIKNLFNIAINDKAEVAREAIYCFTNIIGSGDANMINSLVDYGIIPILVDIMRSHQEQVPFLISCMKALETILQFGKDAFKTETEFNSNPYLIELAQAGGMVIIEQLQNHPDSGVYILVARLIENYLIMDGM